MDQMNKTILLVEDNSDDAALTPRAFKRNNMLDQPPPERSPA